MILGFTLAYAASLDNLEIGGPWGSPTATDGTAVWWNPAGLARGEGTRLQAEGAPTFATVTYERADPGAGTDILKLSGVIPQLGAVTDFGVEGLGVGVGLSVPIARGGEEVSPPGAGAYHLMEGMNQALYAQLGLAYAWKGKVAVGATAALIRSSWTATLLNDTLVDLDHAITAQGEDSGYTDALLESPDYAATLSFGELTDVQFGFSAGLQAAPTDNLELGITYVSGASVANEGELVIQFGCPPQSDTVGRFGAEQYGICYADVPAHAQVSYRLPDRVHAGVAFHPTDAVRLEALGGWVHWSVFDDYDIVISDAQVATVEGAELVNQTRAWARDNRDSVWAGVDAKGELPGGKVLVGGRVLYDQAAVPDHALSTNNYDANTFLLSGLLAVRPFKQLEIGASYTHQVIATRTVTSSAFAMTIDGEPNEDRWFYPHGNGTYRGSVSRLGVQVRARF